MALLAWPIAAVLLVNLAILLFVSAHAPGYLSDSRLNTNADAIHYVRLGENFWQRGAYSRQDGPPYVPDVHRTPVYPLLAGGVTSALGRIWPLYAVQVIAQAGTIGAVVVLAAAGAGPAAGLVAGVLAALDSAGAIANWQALSEPVFVCLSTLTILAWTRVGTARGNGIGTALVGGVLAGLTALTRPQGLYLGLLLTFLLAAWGGFARDWRRVGRAIALLAGLLITVAPWVARNYATFGIARLSTIDSLTMAYYGGAGVVRLRDDVDARTAEARVAHEYGLVPKNVAHNYWLTTKSPAELDAEQQTAAGAILGRYPWLFVRSGVLGVLQACFSHNTPELAAMTGRTWSPLGLGRLIRGDMRGAVDALRANGPVLAAVFVLQVLYVPLLAVLAIAGAWRGLSTGDWTSRHTLCVVLLALVYYAASIAVHGLGADARFRAPMVPLACVCAAYAFPRSRMPGSRWGAVRMAR